MNVPITTNQRKAEFDKKLKQIEADELRLKNLEQELTQLQSRFTSEARPIVEEFCQIRFENLTRLQHHLAESNFKKKDKRHIINLMLQLAFGLQEVGDPRAEAFLDELLPEQEVKTEETYDEDDFQKFKPMPAAPKPVEGTLEIKSLFRQLAKAFHPDKEPLEHLKEEKTTLMKKITAAYENQDLYGLLKLEKEHLGPREFTEDKMELYIKYINNRLKELKAFEAKLKKHGPLATVYKIIYSQKVTMQEYNFRHELSKIEDEVQKEKELQQILWDSSTLKSYLKT